MAFSRVLLYLFLTNISIAALGADNPANAALDSTETQNGTLGFQSTTSRDSIALVNPLIQNNANPDLLGPEKARSGSYSLSDLNGDVCYTIRSYKVRRTERLRDNQSGMRGYSTCEMASDYRVRSADAKAKDSASQH